MAMPLIRARVASSAKRILTACCSTQDCCENLLCLVLGLGKEVSDQNKQKNAASHPALKQGSKPVLYLPLSTPVPVLVPISPLRLTTPVQLPAKQALAALGICNPTSARRPHLA